MGFNNVKRSFHTIKHLKLKQIVYRIIYTVKNKFNKAYNEDVKLSLESLNWNDTIQKTSSYSGNLEFTFLNINYRFKGKVDWNIEEFGKLWTYNLNYFDFLNQPSIEKPEALHLIRDYVASIDALKDGLEPYPTSLRGINWVKYLSKENVHDKRIDISLYNQYLRLLDNLEFHILGNHLLENGFSLLFGSYYFRNNLFYDKAKKIIEDELKEQILFDGAHFELSPMYHQIILDRILDCIFLVKNNTWKDNLDFLSLLELKAKNMVSWLSAITFRDGTIPMVNDSTFGISPSTSSLIKYSEDLGILHQEVDLFDSGYRRFTWDSYQFFADVGQVGPSYQPGHAHADTFSFIFHTDEPIIVDPGISTYNIGEIRELERSTKYHNTVSVDDANSSIVWAGFRVANRAKVSIEIDNNNHLKASHDGYKIKKIKHTRSFKLEASEILINDFIDKNIRAQAHFHFHPNCKLVVEPSNNKVIVGNVSFTFKGAMTLEQKTYFYAFGYNNRVQADKISVTFKNKLATEIKIES